MSDEERKSETEHAKGERRPGIEDGPVAPAQKRDLIPFPALIAIALYLLLLAVVIVFGVVGGHYPALFLILPVFLFAASGGLVMLFRWAWAMALAAVLMLGAYHLWIFTRFRAFPSLIQGLLNLFFFFYLVRTELREKLR